MRVLSLFSGIGGLELGLERAGFTVVGQCEIDPFCRRVLGKHWPDVWRWDDVRTLTGEIVRENCGPIDLICGGFPCQDISDAGSRVGILGSRSGLWREYARLVRETRPRFVVVENSPSLARRGMGTVLADLAESGLDAEWCVLAASDFGAPHVRERMFIVGYAGRQSGERGNAKQHQGQARPTARLALADRHHEANQQAARLHAQGTFRYNAARSFAGNIKRRFGAWAGWESSTPELCRMDDGIPGRLDRLRALGNAVVPQVAEFIGRMIMDATIAQALAGRDGGGGEVKPDAH